jgi:hypothetical protein
MLLKWSNNYEPDIFGKPYQNAISPQFTTGTQIR